MRATNSELPEAEGWRAKERRAWSRGEEIANSGSHAAGCVAALVVAPFLLHRAASAGTGAVVAAAVFAAAAALLYFCSAMHHGLRPGLTKDYFERLDHAAIYLLIAGTYTPFAVGPLWGVWGWGLLAIVWPLALLGVLLNVRRGLQHPLLSTGLYIGMGWMMLFALKPLVRQVPAQAAWLLIAGGVAYTGGLLFYHARRLPFHHLAWHLCVLTGTALHYLAVWRYTGTT